MYHKQQSILEHHRTMVGENHRTFGSRFDIVEYLAVVGVDNVGK